MAVYEARDPTRAGIYSFENRPKDFPPAFERKFRANKKAWKYFTRHAPSIQRTTIFWVLSAKTEDTRVRRFEALIADCAGDKPNWPRKAPTLSR